MPSSIKMIKATHVMGSQSTAKIETKIDEKISTVHEDAAGLEVSGQSQARLAQKKAAELLTEAEQKRQQMMQEAFQESEELKKQAYEEAYQAGLEAGQQDGYQEGYVQGTEQARIENEQEKEKIQLMLEETVAEIDNYKYDKKVELIELASHMAEKIVHKEIDASDKGILELAQPYFYQLDRDEEHVSITVHPSQRDHLESHLTDIELMMPGTRFVIYSNPQIEEKGLIIESSRAVFDLQIKKQLEAMLQEFDEMERTVNA